MIYTITTNPSLDYYLSFRGSLKPNENNRSDFELYDAGGKGVNVSIFLNAMSIQSTALGFLGGFTADFYLDQLKKFPKIQPMFTGIKDHTRINVKIMSDQELSLNAKGPHVSNEEFLSVNFIFFYGVEIVILGIYAILWQQIIKKYPHLARKDI